eukprot:CAMPEP_0195508198 /NCGR_PEP_ID=MMETSP0794_2-20130614/1482_1 /TAXON_ID=515487 /ORGANISM="Stephanopyxis turris, Strain CCMP 815" /LENGTH=419 /DNA_ID=CAMNT_0040635105 /DNA_START=205 /DNA_END=1464 /DNA_ORIENTATION=-
MSASSSSSSPLNIVVIGGGIQGSSVAHHIAKSPSLPPNSLVTILESEKIASAASGKGGGFMARSWGDGGPTQQLHHLAFDMYESLSAEIGCTSYRKLPVLSVQPGKRGVENFKKRNGDDLLPDWLDGNVGGINVMGLGDDTAQITPLEFATKLVESDEKIEVCLGTCTGVTTTDDESDDGTCKKVTGITYAAKDGEEEKTIPCDAVVVSAGPWSCAAEDWFDGAVSLPMEGIKSTSIVWKKPEGKDEVDATALFCGEDHRFGTHLEVYPRPDGTIYLCGIGGSDYIPKEELKSGAFRQECNANPSRVDAASDSFREMSAQYRADGELDRIQACMRPCPPDAMPYMGGIPGYEGAFINAGHNCWGIAWAPACGKAMAELVLDGQSTSIDLTPFDPSRFNPKRGRGGRGRKRGTASVGEQW